MERREMNGFTAENEMYQHLVGSGAKNQYENWNPQIQNKKTKNETNSDFSIEIQHDSYTAEVAAFPLSFDWN
jgi:hypothetical protein